MEKDKLLYEVFPGSLRDLIISRITRDLLNDIVDGELTIDQNHVYLNAMREKIPELKEYPKGKVSWHTTIKVEGCD